MTLPSDHDVVVIGGGPAGSLAASLVRRQDPSRRVLVLERAVFPRHHVGESSIPGWRPILERAGVLGKIEASGVMRKVGSLFEWGRADDERWTVDFRDPSTGGASPASWQVDRARLDHLLLDHARSLGAEVREGVAVKAVDRLDPGGFRVSWEDGDGRRGDATAGAVVDASGQQRLLARLFGVRVVPFDDMNNFAVYGYWKGSKVARFAGPPAHERERWTYIAASPDGWIWHIPTLPDLVSVGLVTDAATIPKEGGAALEELYLRNVRGADGVRDLLADAELSRHPLAPGRLVTVRDWAYHAEEACGPGWFLVGDAAAFVDPILSSGLSIAAHGASLAANALHTLWTDPSIDASLLRESYTAAYHDMAASYHRLARIWYSRNFKHATWHWEAKRQRLRTGRHPEEETSADAFLHLALGRFANPIEGAFGDPGFRHHDFEPNMRMLQAHLFKGEAAAGPAVDGAGFDPGDVEAARRALGDRSRARWRELLGRKVALRGCTWREAESYFTDRDKDRWERVRYAEVAPEGEGDRFHRVVFPARSILPLIGAGRSLRDAVRAFCRAAEPGSMEREELVLIAQRQALQLDLHGWLDADAGGPPGSAALPPPLVALASRSPIAFDVDLSGDTISLGPRASRILLVAADVAQAGRYYKRTATTAFSYAGDFAAARPVIDRLIDGFQRWEREAPRAAGAFWSEAAALAGETGEIAAS